VSHIRTQSISSSPDLPGAEPIGMPVVSSCLEHEAGREALEQYISGIFSAAYDAKILEYMPLLFSLTQEESFTAALGLRSAARGKLFCENYFDSCAQQQVLSLYGMPVQRPSIMELGNLVASAPGQSSLLYLLIASALHAADVKYLLFAANKTVRASVKRAGFTPKTIQIAEKECLGLAGENWGRYYEGEPLVMLADIALTIEQANAQPSMCQVLQTYEHTIHSMAQTIREYCR
jgi:hypothetical protein